MNRRIASLLLIFALPALAGATTLSESLFSKGNTAYVAAENATDNDAALASYKEAAASYKKAIEAGDQSWAAYYNLGNTYFRLGDYGNSVFCYERAFAIDPVRPETESNITKAREAAGLTPVRAQGRIEAWGTRFPMRWFLWGAALGGWAFLAAFVLPFFYSRHRLATVAASLAALALFGTSLVGMYAWHIHAQWRIVITADTPMLAAPDEKASEVRKLSPATCVSVVRTYDKWIFVRAEQGDEGWVLAERAASVWSD
jgi:tetratricopeptide (TPR) repeat protein